MMRSKAAPQSQNIKKLTSLGLLTSISIVLVYLIHFPIFPAAPYLEYDMADVPILVGTFMFGVPSGLLLTLTVSLLQGMLISGGWVGAVMHFFATGAFVLTAGFIYERKHSAVSAMVGLLVGTMVMAAFMIPLNLFFTVHFNGAPRESVIALLMPVIIPFNLIKAGVNSILSFSLFKGIEKAVVK